MLLTTLACAALAAHPLPPPAPADTSRPQVLVLGTFHMGNPGADYANMEVPDPTTPERQRQLQEVVDRIAAFRPTKVAVEVPYGNAAVNERYARYLRGEYALGRDEVDQVAFRLARALGHARVYPVDYREDMDFGAVMGYAAQRQPALAGEFQAVIGRVIAEGDSALRHGTFLDAFRAQNDPAWLDAGHGLYMRLAEVGLDSSYVGTEQLSRWFDRNLRIFANLLRTIDSPGDRVVVLMGSSHAAILRRFVRDHPGVELVEAADYLR